MCYRFPVSGDYVVVMVCGECVIVFQSKPCVMNSVSILYISPMTDQNRHTSHPIPQESRVLMLGRRNLAG